jgi:4-azaleucine resistance transporter AzlC
LTSKKLPQLVKYPRPAESTGPVDIGRITETTTDSWSGSAHSAIRDTIPVAMGYIPLGTAYGLLVTNAGLDWYWAPVSSLTIFAGAMQFLSVGLLTAGTPLATVATTTLVINFRHVFYGLSFPFHRLEGFFQKLYGLFALTDETYSLVASKQDENLSGRRIHLIQVFSQMWWVLGSTLGAVASVLLPSSIEGLDFALTGLFVVLAQEHAYRRENLRSMAYGLIAALIAYAMGSDQFLTIAIGAFLVILVAQWVLMKRKRKETAR